MAAAVIVHVWVRVCVFWHFRGIARAGSVLVAAFCGKELCPLVYLSASGHAASHNAAGRSLRGNTATSMPEAWAPRNLCSSRCC